MTDLPTRQPPEWAVRHLVTLAKIHDNIADAQNEIQVFMSKQNISVRELNMEKLTTPATEPYNQFHAMLESRTVRSYRDGIRDMIYLSNDLIGLLGKKRRIEDKFPKNVEMITDLESPHKDLFSLHGGGFPMDKVDLISNATWIRRAYNTVRHIEDRQSHDKRKTERTYKFFFNEIKNAQLGKLIQLFEMFLSAMEFVETKQTQLVDRNYLHTQIRAFSKQSLHFAKPESIKNALGANNWSDYVEVEHHQEFEGESEDALAINQLDYLTRPKSRDSVVEINAYGGYGKTKLAREYILRSIDGKLEHRKQQYEYYLYYTAKSEQQGEVRAKLDGPLTESPDDWSVGGGDFIPNLSFSKFLTRVCGTFGLDLADGQNGLIQYLKEHEVFILLDNFEDVLETDIGKYKRFFGELDSDVISRFVITSRREPTYGRASLQLTLLSEQKAIEMLYRRYLYEIKEDESEYRLRILTELSDAHKNNAYSPVDAIVTKVQVPENEGDGLPALKQNLRHPIYVRYIANVLANPEVLSSTSNQSGLIDLITTIINDPAYGFWKWHADVVAWMLNHAFDKIKDNEHCVFILKQLLTNTSGLNRGDFRKPFMDSFPDCEKPLEAISKAIQTIQQHREFLEETKDDGPYILTDNARRHVVNLLQIPTPPDLPQIRSSTEDYIRVIKGLIDSNITDWNKLKVLNAAVKSYMEHDTNYDREVLAAAAVSGGDFVKSNNLDSGTIHTFIEFFQILADNDTKKQLVVSKSGFLAEQDIFSQLGTENLQSLANVFMNEATWNDHVTACDEPNQRTSVLIFVTKTLTEGVQGRLEVLFDGVNKLLSTSSFDTLAYSLVEYDYEEAFGEFIYIYRRQIDWSLSNQVLFEEYVSGEKILLGPKHARFARISQQDLEDGWTVEVHPKGQPEFTSDQHLGYTINFSPVNNVIEIFIPHHARDVPEKIPQQPPSTSITLSSNVKSDRFKDWVESAKLGHMGVSSNDEQMGVDLYLTCKLYNEIGTIEKDNFSRAQEFKSLFREVYGSKKSSLSTAFIVAFRINNHSTVTLDEASNAVSREFDRRINKFLETEGDPNDFYSSSDVSNWKNRFDQILESALNLLNGDDSGVRNEISKREQKTPTTTVQNPTNALNRLLSGESSVGTVGRHDRSHFILPNAFKQALREIEGRPYIRWSAFVDDIVKFGGDLHQSLRNEETARKNGRMLEPWLSNKKWLDSVTNYIWNQEKAYKSNDDLYYRIEVYHFKKYGKKS